MPADQKNDKEAAVPQPDTAKAAEPETTGDPGRLVDIGNAATLTPIQIFAVSIAYIIDADHLRPNEEKASLVALLGKHVSRGEFTEKGLADLARFGFERSSKQDLQAFLDEASPKLSNLQRASIYMNVMEAMLVDGTVRESEQIVMKKFQDAFRLDHESVLAIRELIYVKNDTRMFLYPEHPRNSNEEFLAISYTRRRT